MPEYIPEPPSREPVVLSRDVLGLLALSKLRPATYRLLLTLIAYHDPETGVTALSQNQMTALLKAPKATVNQGIAQLVERNFIIEAAHSAYTLHPLLTNGATPDPLRDLPMITIPDDASTARQRERYRTQMDNLQRDSLR